MRLKSEKWLRFTIFISCYFLFALSILNYPCSIPDASLNSLCPPLYRNSLAELRKLNCIQSNFRSKVGMLSAFVAGR